MGHDPTRGLKLAFIDMSGTTFQDNGLMERAFIRTVQDLGVDTGSLRFAGMLAYLRDTLGQSKVRVFQQLFQGDPATAIRATQEFERQLDELLSAEGVQPVEGAAESIERLHKAGLKVCLATGYNRHSQNMILESLGWMGLADLSLCPADAGRGRPYPDMILTALLALDIGDVREVMVVGDTTADMQAGTRAGAGLKVGVLTGAHLGPALKSAGADVVVDSIRAVPALLQLPSSHRDSDSHGSRGESVRRLAMPG